ncbi:glycosyltransferase [Apibacter sp. HY039]|uniref:glycosyltransferase n=1 Tax=Apibacter sp. HY039 TaxID=2501476 RepID=UPI0013E3CB4C|nr:glycosyltransferase [Apibacter sp. HY039]
MKILISVINNISTDQRVSKVCSSLKKHNFNINIIGTNLYGSPPLKKEYPAYRIPLIFNKSFLLFAEFNIKLFWRLLLRTDKNTILASNDLDSLLPNYLVSKIKKVPLVFDSHEIYSELPSVQGRYSQKVWKLLEKFLIPRINSFYTVSNGYASYFYKTYNKKPSVINNTPYFYYKELNECTASKIIIYQGVLKEGRGLIHLIHAMALLPQFKLWIVGTGLYENRLKTLVRDLKLNNIDFLGHKLPEELKIITPQASLGVSLEENCGLSYYYSLPNKVFDYIHSGIPIVGTFLPEIKSVIEENQIGEVIINHEASEIAKKIRLVMQNGKKFYQYNLRKAAEKYCWENQENKLIDIYLRASNSDK